MKCEASLKITGDIINRGNDGMKVILGYQELQLQKKTWVKGCREEKRLPGQEYTTLCR